MLVRRTPARLALVVALAALAAGGTARAGVEDVPGMFLYRTTHYLVATDVSPELAEVVGRHMEEILGDYSERFSDYGRPSRRFDVAVFGSQERYEGYVPEQVRGSTGVFVSRQRLLAANAEGRTTEEVLRTLYHEGFHQFMHEVVSDRCPVWLNEGLAEYFSEATWDGHTFDLGQVPTQRLHVVRTAIRDGGYVPFAQLFAMSPEAWLQDVRQDAHRASLIYSEAWSIVHFLVHGDGGAYAERLNQLLHLIAGGAEPAEAVQVSLGPDMGAFEQAWARYVMSLEPSPKFVCRDNTEAIMLVARVFRPDPREFTSVSWLRHAVLTDREWRWEITRPTGQKVSSDDREAVARLFRCPLSQGTDAVSYVVMNDAQTGMPVLVCNEHPGVVITAYYVPRAGGGYGVEVEEQVRELADPALVGAVESLTLSQR